MPDPNRRIAGLRCLDLLSLLPDYVEGELDAAQAGPVDAHLEDCAHCAKFGGEYTALVEELQRPRPATASDHDVRARLAKRIEAVWAEENP